MNKIEFVFFLIGTQIFSLIGFDPEASLFGHVFDYHYCTIFTIFLPPVWKVAQSMKDVAAAAISIYTLAQSPNQCCLSELLQAADFSDALAFAKK